MRKINAIVDLDLAPLPESKRGAGEVAEPINRNAGGFVKSRNQKRRGQMREMMLDVMHFRFDPLPESGLKFAAVVRIERLLHRRGAPNVFNFLRDQLRMRPVSENKSEPAQIVYTRFAIDRDVIDIA